MEILAILSIASGCLSLLCLLALHFVSPEFQPSWRMVSEYALGKNKRLLTGFFFLWGTSSILLAALLWGVVGSIWVTVGVVLLFISSIGAIMGGLFDVKHPKHGLAFALGVPTLPVAALLIGHHLVRLENWSECKTPILLSAHSTWVSVVLMGVAMMVMFSGFKKSGVSWDKDSPPPESLPPGVIALGGYANRLVIFCYVLFLMVVAYCHLSQ